MFATNTQFKGRKPKSFGLIGLVVSVVIITILAGFVVPHYPNTSTKRMVKAAIGDMNNIQSALRIFDVDHGRFPTTDEGLQILVTDPNNLEDWSPTLEKLPVDPWGHQYVYRASGSSNADYDLYSTGPSGRDGNADNIRL